eukprot:m.647630 g.647630  ORF g.647630 m.647630 type:complete len:50 (-) comp58375_c0_seq7:952-1101(-)
MHPQAWFLTSLGLVYASSQCLQPLPAIEYTAQNEPSVQDAQLLQLLLRL